MMNWSDTRDQDDQGLSGQSVSGRFGRHTLGRVDLIADSAVVRHNPRAEYRGLEEGGLLTQLDTGQHHGLNPVGQLIWSLMGGQTFAELVDEVAAQLADPPPELAEDIADFIEALKERKLVDVFYPDSA